MVIRFADPEEAMARLKANRNANKDDRDGRVMDALQVRAKHERPSGRSPPECCDLADRWLGSCAAVVDQGLLGKL